MPVHFETTSAISSSVTLLRSSVEPFVSASCAACELLLELGNAAVLQLRHAREIAARGARPRARACARSSSSLICAAPCSAAFSAFQISSRSAYSLLELVELLSSVCQALLRRLVLLLLQRLALDLELDEAAVEAVHLLGLGVDLHADARGGLVDQVDGLVRQLAVGDVAVRERRGGDDRRVGDLDAVVHRVALLQAAQDRDRVLDARLADEHLLEAPLERGVLLDVLAVLVERGRADAVQLAARERGLEHVAGVHRAFGLAGADHRCAARR